MRLKFLRILKFISGPPSLFILFIYLFIQSINLSTYLPLTSTHLGELRKWSRQTKGRRQEVYSLENGLRAVLDSRGPRPRWGRTSIHLAEVGNIPFRMHRSATNLMLCPLIYLPPCFCSFPQRISYQFRCSMIAEGYLISRDKFNLLISTPSQTLKRI